MEQNSLLTVKEAAALLKVNTRTIYRAISEGALHAHRYGKRIYRLTKEDLEQWVKK